MPRGQFTPEQRQRAAESRREGAADRKRAKLAACEATVEALRRDTPRPLPAWVQGMADRAKMGNVRALIGLKCADCSGFQREEIRLCPVVACPLHPLRPFGQRDGAEGTVGVDAEAVAACDAADADIAACE